MAANKILNIQPVALGTSAANILNCGITSLAGPVGYTQTQPYLVLKHVRAVNNDSVAHTVKTFKGATAASAVGTEVMFAGTSVPANSWVEWFGQMRLDSADFLTGLADVANKVTLEIDAEIGVS